MTATMKKGDSLPSIEMTLTDSKGLPVELTGATCRVIIAKRGQTPIVDAPAAIVDAAAGTIRYDWSTGDTDRAGIYAMEVEITLADGRKMTCPNDSTATVHIVEDLA